MKKTGVISGRIMWSAYRFVTQKIGITSKPFVFGTQKWLQYHSARSIALESGSWNQTLDGYVVQEP